MKRPMHRALVWLSVAGMCACSSDGEGDGSSGTSGGAAGLPPDGSGGATAESPSAGGPAAAPLSVESVTPEDGASDVALDAVIEVRFSAALDPTTATEGSVVVRGPNGAIEGELTVSGEILRFVPASPLPLRTPVSIGLGAALASSDGAALTEPFEAQFSSRDGEFRDPVQINVGAAASLFLRGNDAGDLIATWTDLQVTSSVEATIFDAELGTWSEAQPIESDDQLAFSSPVAGIAPNGDSIVAWRGGGWTRYAGGWSPATVGASVVLPSLALSSGAALSVRNAMDGASYLLLPNGSSEWTEAQPLPQAGRVDAIDALAGGFIAVGVREGELLAGQLDGPDGSWSEFVSLATIERLERLRLTTHADSAAVAWLDLHEQPATETEELSFVNHAGARVFADDAWSPAIELPEGAELPWLSVAAGGRALAVWTREDAVSVSAFAADQGWTEPKELADSSELAPSGAVDGAGNLMALWPSREQIAVQRQVEGGEWQALEPIDSQVTVALWSHVDVQGRISLIWQNGSGIWWTRFE